MIKITPEKDDARFFCLEVFDDSGVKLNGLIFALEEIDDPHYRSAIATFLLGYWDHIPGSESNRTLIEKVGALVETICAALGDASKSVSYHSIEQLANDLFVASFPESP